MAADERMLAWQCIGCGRIESPQPCIGVCQDLKVELVDASELDRVSGRLRQVEEMLRVLSLATPKAGEWERSYLQMQERARRLLSR